MTIVVDRQLRVLTEDETAADDALTVAAVRELAWGMNNFKALVSGQHLISQVSPAVNESSPYLWASAGTGTDEQLVHIFAPRHLPWGYDEIWFQVAGVLSATPTGVVKWRLYASTVPYTGPVEFSQAYLGSTWSWSSQISISSDTHECPAGVTDLVGLRNPRGDCFLTLTSQRTDAGDEGYLTALMAVARGSGT